MLNSCSQENERRWRAPLFKRRSSLLWQRPYNRVRQFLRTLMYYLIDLQHILLKPFFD